MKTILESSQESVRKYSVLSFSTALTAALAIFAGSVADAGPALRAARIDRPTPNKADLFEPDLMAGSLDDASDPEWVAERLAAQGERGDALGCVEPSDPEAAKGDPMLVVPAAGDAREVVAYFPGGALPMKYDDLRRHWAIRVPVNKGLRRGQQKTFVRVTKRDGKVDWREISHHVSPEAPPFFVNVARVARPGHDLRIEVDPREPVTEVTAEIPGITKGDAKLRIDAKTGFYTGTVSLPSVFPGDKIAVRVVVRDVLGGKQTRDVEISAAVGETTNCR